MKNFKFQLESLLQLRSQIREQLFLNWAASTQALQKAVQEKMRLENQLKGWQDQYRKSHSHSVSAREFWREQRAAAVLHQHWLEQDRSRQNLENRTRVALNAWQEARRKEEVLERLKQRARNGWIKQFDQQEQKQNDDRAAIMAFQKQRQLLQSEQEEVR